VGFVKMDYDFSDEVILKLHKRIGLNVKKFRMEKGLSQLELAYAMGNKSVSLISSAELANDNKKFNIEHLYKISTILDIEMCEFLK
jgi:transcriptional regulator with XRE-family HTH domain